MSIWELLLCAFSLSMDAFAIAICKGLSVGRVKPKHVLSVGIWFGGAQAIMPLIGYLIVSLLRGLITNVKLIEAVDHWIVFVLLAIIGIGMIKESREETKELNDSFSFKVMLPLALAGSIDALASGAAFAFDGETSIVIAVTAIGAATFIFSSVGIIIGNKFGERYRSVAELVGGIVLILLGAKALITGLLEGVGANV